MTTPPDGPYTPPAYEMLDYFEEIRKRAESHIAILNASVCRWRWDLVWEPGVYVCDHGFRAWGRALDGKGPRGIDLAVWHWRRLHPGRPINWQKA